MRDAIDVYVVGAVLVMAGMSDNIFPAPFVSTGIEIGFWDNFLFQWRCEYDRPSLLRGWRTLP